MGSKKANKYRILTEYVVTTFLYNEYGWANGSEKKKFGTLKEAQAFEAEYRARHVAWLAANQHIQPRDDWHPDTVSRFRYSLRNPTTIGLVVRRVYEGRPHAKRLLNWPRTGYENMGGWFALRYLTEAGREVLSKLAYCAGCKPMYRGMSPAKATIYYKFGPFDTPEEAENMARHLGMAQDWMLDTMNIEGCEIKVTSARTRIISEDGLAPTPGPLMFYATITVPTEPEYPETHKE